MKYLDVKTDFAFKKVFGSAGSTEVLRSFLNAMLYEGSAQSIEQLSIVDPYNIPMLKGMKDTFVDVKAMLNDGSTVIVEMQVLNHAGFEKRVLYNAAKNYANQLLEGQAYQLLNPVIALTMVDFDMFEGSQAPISRYKLIEKSRLVDYSGDIELIFVELPKFKKQLLELQTEQDQWIYFVQNAGKLHSKPDNFIPAINQAFEAANEAGLTAAELEAQYKRREFIMVQKSIEQGAALSKEQGRAQGLLEGKAVGLAEGEARGEAKALQKLIASGMSEAQARALLA